MKIAKADLVSSDHNLRDEYEDFADLERACEQFMAEVNPRPHRITRRPPVEMLGEEHEYLHRLARMPHTLCFGQTRKVNWQSLISIGGAQYSVSHQLIDERVWARTDGSELIVVHVDGHQGAQGGGPPPVDHAWATRDLRGALSTPASWCAPAAPTGPKR